MQKAIPRRYTAEVGQHEDEIKVHGQQGQRVQLVGADGAQPDDLRVPVVGEEAEVAGAVVAEAREELGGGEHEARVEEPAVDGA
ncbi:hypothetical protein V495_02253 [Pseudogymnoascus sp. VKM F-4514 (FW-929)]|nr:hypothetical protein V495_02253 [Pseudogymnoascus sp. VKM F-4514 (FW-929)]KFY60312.1 hypothetical protein V497_03729 [Pseudogymnoascus sp. VKM F-4516 (FW-969)]